MSKSLPLVSTLVLTFVSIVSFMGCTDIDEGAPGLSFDRGSLLKEWADQTIVPAYAHWQESTSQLEGAVALLVDEPNASRVEAAREALKSAYASWQSVATFDFGPASDRALLATTNTFPVDTAGVLEDLALTNWAPGTPSSLSRMGLPALDYLLFSEADANVVAQGLSEAPERGQHLLRLVGFLAEESEAVFTAWNSEYRDQFVASTGTELGSGLGATLNAFNRTFESNLRKQKLGLPSGVSTFSQTPLPGHVEAPFAGDLSLHLMKEAFLSYRNLYLGVPVQGDGTLGLDDYLKSLGDVHRGAQLDADIRAQLDAAEDALDRLESPLAEFVVNRQDLTFEAYAELQGLVVLWKVDMMSALGVLVTYQDNDGD